jgi:hypothetical protein
MVSIAVAVGLQSAVGPGVAGLFSILSISPAGLAQVKEQRDGR